MRNRSRGMTLIELMIVVVIVGVLSVLAVTGYRRFTLQARNAEAMNFLGVVRAAQETYFQAFGQYCGPEDFEYHPANTPPVDQKVNWGQPDGAWRDLGIKSPGQVWFVYGIKAGRESPGGHFPPGPWFIAQANGNWDRDAVYSTYEVSSATNSVFIENENE